MARRRIHAFCAAPLLLHAPRWPGNSVPVCPRGKRSGWTLLRVSLDSYPSRRLAAHSLCDCRATRCHLRWWPSHDAASKRRRPPLRWNATSPGSNEPFLCAVLLLGVIVPLWVYNTRENRALYFYRSWLFSHPRLKPETRFLPKLAHQILKVLPGLFVIMIVLLFLLGSYSAAGWATVLYVILFRYLDFESKRAAAKLLRPS